MKSLNSNRNIITLPVTGSTASPGIDVDQIEADATSNNITITLPKVTDGADHQLLVVKTDATAGTVTITDGGSLSFVLSAQYQAGNFQMNGSGTWRLAGDANISGSGNVTGPSVATLNAPAVFADTTGKVIKNSTPTGTGNPVMQTSPTLTTPVLGVATGTSLAASGLITSSSPTAGIGYATGAGGAQTQATDKSTTVVSNTLTTAITMNSAALNAGVTVGFTFTNSSIAATDTVICTHQSAGTSGAYTVNAFPGTGSAIISVRNNTAGNLSEAIVLRVTVIKSISA